MSERPSRRDWTLFSVSVGILFNKNYYCILGWGQRLGWRINIFLDGYVRRDRSIVIVKCIVGSVFFGVGRSVGYRVGVSGNFRFVGVNSKFQDHISKVFRLTITLKIVY